MENMKLKDLIIKTEKVSWQELKDLQPNNLKNPYHTKMYMKPCYQEKLDYVKANISNPENWYVIEPVTEYMVDHVYYMIKQFEKSDFNDYTIRICKSYNCITFFTSVNNQIIVSSIDYCVFPDTVKTMWSNGFSDYLTHKKYRNKQFINLVKWIRSLRTTKEIYEFNVKYI